MEADQAGAEGRLLFMLGAKELGGRVIRSALSLSASRFKRQGSSVKVQAPRFKLHGSSHKLEVNHKL